MPEITVATPRSATLPPLVSGALPLVGHATQFLRDQLQLLERGYAEHGDIFRLRLGRRPAIVMVGPELARWVFKYTDDHTLSIGPSLAFTIRLFGPDFYFLAPPEEYQHQRETLLPLFRAHMAVLHLAIPAGADVFVAPVLSHRLPVLFSNADRYDPDRYVANPKQTSYLHGFGGGTHRCLGEHFADLLAHVTVTRLLQHYQLTLVSPDPVQVRTPAFKGPRSPCLIRYRANE